ncbi:MAG: hypothetical protein P8Y94_00585 [Acidobacteriota bacterium]
MGWTKGVPVLGQIVIFSDLDLGDTALDFPMLRNVDHPVLVRGRDGSYAQCADIPRLCRVDGLWSGGVEQGHSGFH